MALSFARRSACGIPSLMNTAFRFSRLDRHHIQNIGFVGIDQGNLTGRQFRRDQIFFDSIGMNPIIDLGKVALDVPTELFHLLGLEELKLLD